MKKILITGGAGYIGSKLISYLTNSKTKITILDSFIHGQESLLPYISNKNIEIIRGDVRDKSILDPLLKDNDIIIPLAALVGAPLCDKNKDEAISINEKSINYLCKKKSNDQIILFPMTNSGYGIGGNDYCDESSPLRPVSLYGKTKVNAENYISQTNNFIVLRLATVFGVSNRIRTDLLVNNFVWRAVKEKVIVLYESNYRRNFIHINDVCRCFKYSLDNFSQMKNNIFNLGLSSANMTKKELCDQIKKYIEDFEYIFSEIGKDPDSRDYLVSNKKIEKIGFKAKFSLSYGIKELIKLYSFLDPKVFSNY
jgi:nucleoside-diphosphate-sugar epimerase